MSRDELPQSAGIHAGARKPLRNVFADKSAPTGATWSVGADLSAKGPVYRASVLLLQQLIHRDREFPDPLAGCVVDSVGHRSGNADDADFANALGTQRVDDVVLFINE